MQAIVTRYHPPTNTRGARYSATCEAARVSLPDPASGAQDMHHAAVAALLRRMGWTPDQGKAYAGCWVRGSAPRQRDGYTYVLLSNVTEYNEAVNTWEMTSQ